jgi:hypothetical protein
MSSWDKLNYENSYFAIAKGEVSDSSVVFLSGHNLDADPNTMPETVWNVGGVYPWTAWNGGNKRLYIASSSASDTHEILLNGLDNNYNPISEVITLTGTTYVASALSSYYRLNSAIYLDGNASNVGNITIRIGSASGTIVGLIEDTEGSTSMSIYTVPAGYTAYSVYGDFSCNKGEAARLVAKWRFFGSSFITVYATEIFQQFIVAAPPVAGAIPEKTDIDNQIHLVTTAGTRVFSNQQLILVKNDALHN